MVEASRKVQGSRLRCYGHVMRRDDEHVGRRMTRMIPPGKRRRGRPKRGWSDCGEVDMKEKGVDKAWVYDRPKWWSSIRVSDPN